MNDQHEHYWGWPITTGDAMACKMPDCTARRCEVTSNGRKCQEPAGHLAWAIRHRYADSGSVSIFTAALLAALVPTILVLLLVAPVLAALSGQVQS